MCVYIFIQRSHKTKLSFEEGTWSRVLLLFFPVTQYNKHWYFCIKKREREKKKKKTNQNTKQKTEYYVVCMTLKSKTMVVSKQYVPWCVCHILESSLKCTWSVLHFDINLYVQCFACNLYGSWEKKKSEWIVRWLLLRKQTPSRAKTPKWKQQSDWGVGKAGAVRKKKWRGRRGTVWNQ